MLRGFRIDGERDLVFVPLGINYDRVLEDRTLLRSADPDAARRGGLGALGTTLGFAFHNLHLALRSRWYRFGYACVNFGAPISTRAYCTQRGIDFHKLGVAERKSAIGEFGKHLMAAVGGVVPVLPVPLVAAVLLAQDGAGLSEFELKAQVNALIERLEAVGAHTYIPRKDLDYAVGVGLRMLTLRHLVEEQDGLFTVRQSELPLLRYYANSIAHFEPKTG
jgi:glycerol-3-phosphate O-acyltransferase